MPDAVVDDRSIEQRGHRPGCRIGDEEDAEDEEQAAVGGGEAKDALRELQRLAAAGTAAIFIANIIRMFIVIEVLHYWGKNSIFIAHTIIGRAIFFIIVILIYWYVITRPTLKDVRKKLKDDIAA